MENNNDHQAKTLADVLQQINESVDDFSSQPARSANDRGSFDDYPLHKIATWGDVESAAVLMANNANINAMGEDDETPLHRAIAARHVEMIKFLVFHGADINIKNRYGCSALDDANSSGNSEIVNALIGLS